MAEWNKQPLENHMNDLIDKLRPSYILAKAWVKAWVAANPNRAIAVGCAAAFLLLVVILL